jgi:chromosome segregation ATPase
MEMELQSVSTLLQQRESLQHELNQAINDGSPNDMLRLDSLIKNVGSQLFAAEVVELKNSIESNEIRRADVLEEVELLRKIKVARNERLNEISIDAQKARGEYARSEVNLQFAENESNNLRISIMNLSKKLDELKNKKIQEISNYENTRY